jgi:hypothetical protein
MGCLLTVIARIDVMADLNVVGVEFRPNLLPVPKKNKDGYWMKGAMLYALVASPEGDRMFIHRMRHMSYPKLNEAKATVKTLDPISWVEVVYREWTLHASLIAKDTGEVFFPGFGNTRFSQDIAEVNPDSPPDVKQLAHGFAL